ncbi:hypothetical protein HBI25_143040 [Parastagonospora nodorum]|nr:hypothetical protein HBI09_015150 [Parastagonospora nodorum]KAH4069214.1 hypothetical protein HBH50_110340 [Parastagonospora nodorum]KAH4088284.1 hypothetical protein HBH48_127310 [Parastagonospora nodorum]KAH4607299.1 hypothetical protein HBH82_092780 [Parastagonospora nodorum]KAH4711016.1 hypothetical protein HBH67_030490 [Parastagonospora nodorum]
MKLFSWEAWGIDSAIGFDPNKTFVRSQFVSPIVLASIRAILSLYSFVAIIICYAWLAKNTATISLKDVNIGSYTIQQSNAAIGQSFSFFTYLTFWSLGFYFLVSSVHTFVFAFQQQTWLQKWPKAFQLAHSLYYSTITCFPFLVTIVFWGTMNSGWPAGRFEQWMNLSVHGLNSVFAITEIVLPATAPPPVSHLSVVLLVLSVYLGLSYLTRYTQGFYVYEWMNPAHGNTSIVLHVLGYAAGMTAIFFIVRFAIMGRNMVAARLEARRDQGLREKTMRLDSESDTWSASVLEIERPVRAKGSRGHASQV